MKTGSLFLLMVLLCLKSFSQISLFNSVTRKMIRADEGVVVSFSARLGYIDNFTWQQVGEGHVYVSYTKRSQMDNQNYVYEGKPIQIQIYRYGGLIINYTLNITSSNYETINYPVVICSEFGADGNVSEYQKGNGITERVHEPCDIGHHSIYDLFEEIYLVPKKEIIEGNINITSKSEQSDKATNELGLLTTSSIASGLGISENDVIKLITTNQLKGKKIGDKYFVRKDDFDAFMKK